MKEIISPKPLDKNAKIAIISPAGSVETKQLEEGIKKIEAQGFIPVLGKNLYQKYSFGYSYAGTEKERIADLNWAMNSAEISAIWASRGGYGCQHLIKHLKTKNFKKNPKWYIGYSDNTVIQSFLLKKGFKSIHGQTIKTSSFGVSEESYAGIFDILKGKTPNYKIPAHYFNKPGEAKGRLVGGNLALVYALLGTPYCFDFKDNILFIEEIGENFYALDRMLMALELAGVFKKIKGLIVGGMTNMGNSTDNAEYEKSHDSFAYEIINNRLKNYNFPIIFEFPNGHIYDNRPLIIGSEIEIKNTSKDCEVLSL